MYCPAWIFEICVSRTAFEFLHSEMGLSAFANKYASGLSSIYETFEFKKYRGTCRGVLTIFVRDRGR